MDTWRQAVRAACSQHANALPTSSPLCCSEPRELTQMFCHDIAAKKLEFAVNCSKGLGARLNSCVVPPFFRTLINAFCLILPGCLLGGLFHPNSSWPLKAGLSHILNMCFDSCWFFFFSSEGSLTETKVYRSNSSHTPVHPRRHLRVKYLSHLY